MNEGVSGLVEKGRRSLAASRELCRAGYFDFAVSRAYYSMFYLAEALLLSKGLSFSKHSGVLAALGEHFVKPGLIPAEHHAAILDAFEERNVGDYEVGDQISQEKAKEIIETAERFIDDVGKLLAGESAS